jgi:hypothetical protein
MGGEVILAGAFLSRDAEPARDATGPDHVATSATVAYTDADAKKYTPHHGLRCQVVSHHRVTAPSGGDIVILTLIQMLNSRLGPLMMIVMTRWKRKPSTPTFTGHYHGHELHMHTPINHLVSFTQKAAREALEKLRLKIPGGKMVRE